MNELSLRAALTSVLFGGLTAALAGCPGPAPMGGNGGDGGTGGAGTTTSTTLTTSSTGGSCTIPSDCPMMATACAVSDCKAGTCVMETTPKGTSCGDDPTTKKRCDGAGSCVECIEPTDCANSAEAVCVNGVHMKPATCEQGKCVAAETNCASMQLACKPEGCVSCSSNGECGDGEVVDCKVAACVQGHCQKVPAVASACTTGTCNENAECVPTKYVFVTSFEVKGDLGNVDEADKKCQKAAETAGLDGKWLSWTSDANNSPSSRFEQSPGPYLLLDGTSIVAKNWAELVNPSKPHTINLNEQGMDVTAGTHVWTGTLPDGTPSGSSCNGWSSATTAAAGTFGKVGVTTGGWSKYDNQPCAMLARLYCFQQ